MLRYGLLLSAGVLAGWLFESLSIPVGWLLGAMVAGIIISARWGRQELPGGLQIAAQVMLGLASGAGFPISTMLSMGQHALPLLLMVAFTVGLSLYGGYLLHRWGGIDRATGFMGMLPGAASSMVAVSSEMGADPVAVAIIQYLRVVMVMMLAPLAVEYLIPSGTVSEAAPVMAAAAGQPLPMHLNLAALVLVGIVGTLLGRLLHIPSPSFLGPFLAVVLASWFLPSPLNMPDQLFNAGMVLMGLFIGVRFDVALARRLGRVALLESILVLVLIAFGLVAGYGYHLATGVDTMTAVLGSMPGGMEVQIAAAARLGGNVGLVVAMQMSRYFLILVSGPLIAAYLIRRNGEPEEPPGA